MLTLMRRVGTIVLHAIVLGLATPSAGFAESLWQRVAPKDYAFCALMPQRPEVETIHRSSFVGDTDSTAYHTDTGTTRISISVTEIPRAAAWLAPERLMYSQAKSNLLQSADGVEQSFRKIERNGLPGRELLFAAHPPGETSRSAQAEFFYFDGRMLVVVASHANDTSDTEMVRFFANLEVDREECRGRSEPNLGSDCRRIDIALD